jgi:hypothetical protein
LIDDGPRPAPVAEGISLSILSIIIDAPGFVK